MGHWIIAPILLPALVGAVLLLRPAMPLAWQRLLSTLATLGLAALAATLLIAASQAEPALYRLGNWPAPFGIVLVLDRLAALMLALTSLLALVVLAYGLGTGWDARGRHFHALFQFQLMGLSGAFLTGDAFNLFVFFEVLLIASYGLMIHGGGRDRLRAGVQYIGFNLLGSSLFLFALGLIYAVTGTLNLADLAIKVAALPAADAGMIRVAGVMLLMVFAVKGALVPLQFWLPGTYANAPGPVAALFAVMTKVGAYAVIRVYTLVFAPTVPSTGALFADLLFAAALVTLACGALGLLGARSLPRLVAFGTIASMGTLFLAISAFTAAGLTAALYYLLHSTLAGAALFLIADLVISRRGSADLGETRPPIAQSGLIASLFFAAAIALAGMPPLSGFIGKLMILQALDGPALAPAWTTLLVSSLLMVVGLARAGSQLFWKAHEAAPAAPPVATQRLAVAAVLSLLGLLVALTLFAGPVTLWLQTTVAGLIDPAAYLAANQLGATP